MKKISVNLLLAILVICGVASCTKEETEVLPGSGAYILEAVAKTGMGEIALPVSGENIMIDLPESTDLETIGIEFVISEGATIAPDPSVIRDWSYKHTFTITAEDGTVRTYFTVPALREMGKVFQGSVRLSSQQEIDGFGSNGFTSVGDIYIFQANPADRIDDFSALSSIKEIKGQLVINGIGGRKVEFENLERLGKLIFQAPAVTSISMPNLKVVAEDYIVGLIAEGQLPVEHKDLSTIDLPKLEYVGGNLEFNLLPKLRSLESLSNLREIGGNLSLFGGVYDSLKGLENLESLKGYFELVFTGSSLEGFNFKNIEGGLYLTNIENVTSLAPLASLEYLGGGLAIQNNLSLTSLQGIENIDTHTIVLENLQGLTSLQGLPLRPEMRSINLVSLPLVNSLAGLGSVKEIEERLLLANLGISDLNGMENIVHAGELSLVNNRYLNSIQALSPDLEVTGELEIANSYEITSLETFGNMSSVGGLTLRGLNGLISLSGLENLTEITKGGLFLEYNRNLTDISALSNLESINFYQQSDKLSIRSNSKLDDFCPLSDLIQQYAAIYGRVSLSGNYYNPTTADFRNGNCSGGVGGSGIGGGKG